MADEVAGRLEDKKTPDLLVLSSVIIDVFGHIKMFKEHFYAKQKT